MGDMGHVMGHVLFPKLDTDTESVSCPLRKGEEKHFSALKC